MKTSKGPEITAGWHGVPAVPATDRLPSLDAFRGFVIATMVFVNNLGDGVPPWMKHMGADADGFTFVDLVFPGFLFMVGFSIPLSFHSKISQGVSFLKLSWRVAARAAQLVGIGLLMINAEHHGLNQEATGLSRDLWGALAYLCVILLTLARPKDEGPRRAKVLKFLKPAAAVLLVYLLWIFRANGEGGQLVWLQPFWWGIIGLIGWAYLGSGLIYLAFRGSSTALMGMMAFLAALDIGGRHGLLDCLGSLKDVGNNIYGTHALIALAGILVGNLFTGKGQGNPPNRTRFLVVFGIFLYLAGALLRPLYGYSKIHATVAWGLASAAISCAVYLFFYLVIEKAKARKWADWTLVRVGQNSLLAYILSEGFGFFWRSIFRVDFPWFGDYLSAIVQVGIICAAAIFFTKQKVFLRL